MMIFATVVIKHITKVEVESAAHDGYILKVYTAGQEKPLWSCYDNKKEPTDIAEHIRCLIQARGEDVSKTIYIPRYTYRLGDGDDE